MSVGEHFVTGLRIADKYTLISEIGSGGMGTVWLARNDATRAEVALKIWEAAGSSDVERTKTRFRNEARLSAKLPHRNIVRVFDLMSDPSGALILVMERLQGCTVAAYLKAHGKMDTHAAIGVACGLLVALEQAHRAGVVHRDVKPSNVFLAADLDGHVTPKLLDFGIAKVPLSNLDLTGDDEALGTPRYMSPEQIRGKDVGARSDIFSAATIVYEMLTGVSPFDGDTSAASLARVLESGVDWDPAIKPAVFTELVKALAKEPERRHASATQFADALRAAAEVSDDEMERALKHLRPNQLAVEPSLPNDGKAVIESGRSRSRFGRPVAGVVALCALLGVVGFLKTRGADRREAQDARTVHVQPSPTPSPGGMSVATVETAPSQTVEDLPITRPSIEFGSPPPPAAGRTPVADRQRPTLTKPAKRVATTPGF